MDSIEVVAIGFLLYNVIAFGLQPIIGFLCDGKPEIPIALIGCFLVTIGLLTMSVPWFSLIFSAFGNACFHVGGGTDSLRYANGKMFRSGVFVSTGAVGVAMGTTLGQIEKISIGPSLALMIVSITLVTFFTKNESAAVLQEFKLSSQLPFVAVLILVLVSILIRSYVGGVIPMDWKIGTNLWLLPSLGAFIGKAFGGALGDKFGARRVGVFSLMLSIPFLCLGQNIAILSVIGIVLFNITMPITLCTVASKFPYNPGLAFGLTTLALLCGNVPTFFFRIAPSIRFPVLIVFIVLSAICISLATNNSKGGKSYGRNE